MTRQAFAAMAAGGPVLLDGATGSNLRAAGMPVGVPPERWVLDHPSALLDLQRAYVDAGSRILMAPTFSANRPALDRFGLAGELGALNAALVGLTREAAGGRALVAGDVTTSGKVPDAAPDYTYADALALYREPLGPISYGEAYDVYREQMESLAEAGADLLAVETLMGIDEAAAALDAAGAVCGLPVLCSFSVEADGTVPFGGTALEALLTAQELGAAAVGVNCSVGPDQLEAVVRTLAEAAAVPVIAKPNAGLPVIDELGRAVYTMGPRDFARHMAVLARAGASLLGGCCGSAPDYIRALAEVL